MIDRAEIDAPTRLTPNRLPKRVMPRRKQTFVARLMNNVGGVATFFGHGNPLIQ